MATITEKQLDAAAKKILKEAKNKGINSLYFFATTFERYRKQLEILRSLEAAIDENGPVVEKEYVKNRVNLVANPAISEYNKTATAANGTVSTLLNIYKNLSDEEKKESKLESLTRMLAADDE